MSKNKTNKKDLRILIVGAGIGGLGLAAFLRKKGFSPTVIEQAPEWKTIGYVLEIANNGFAMFEKLGLGAQLKKEGTRVAGYSFKDDQNHKILDCSFKPFEKKYGPALEMERDRVHRLLRDVNEGTDIRMGTRVKSLKQKKDNVEIKFDNGKTETFDLVVGADGIESQVRHLIYPRSKTDYSGFTFWLFWIPRGIYKSKHILTCHVSERKLILLLPTKREKHTAALFMTVSSEDYARDPKKANEFLKKRFRDVGGVVPEILKHLPKTPDLMFHHDDDEEHLRKRWYKGRVVLLGDSAHAISPLMGMGATMALEDAFVLAEELGDQIDVDQAVENYYLRRSSRVAGLAAMSRFAHWLAKASGSLVFFRDLALRLFGAGIIWLFLDRFFSRKI